VMLPSEATPIEKHHFHFVNSFSQLNGLKLNILALYEKGV
jgi:hypothetical protein